jgi:hypothetical protein
VDRGTKRRGFWPLIGRFCFCFRRLPASSVARLDWVLDGADVPNINLSFCVVKVI